MVVCETSVEIDRPLARDVIRYFDIAYLTTLEICGNNVIGVDISREGLAISYIHIIVPHTVLHVVDHPQHLEGQSSVVHRLL